jgi:hypothetical protein
MADYPFTATDRASYIKREFYMFWFIFGLLLGSVAGFIACSLFRMSNETEIPDKLEIKVLHPDPCNQLSERNETESKSRIKIRENPF